jgi:hypothetical protein
MHLAQVEREACTKFFKLAEMHLHSGDARSAVLIDTVRSLTTTLDGWSKDKIKEVKTDPSWDEKGALAARTLMPFFDPLGILTAKDSMTECLSSADC